MARNFLIVPMPPTPNGRLHVGHAAGTYFFGDVMARSLRLQGQRVRVVTGSDVFENWVLAEAHRCGEPTDAVVDRFHDGIRTDLQLLDIGLDAWLDLRQEPDRSRYSEMLDGTLDLMRSHGYAAWVDEPVPFVDGTERAVVGTWISGRCPTCDTVNGGNCCVVCGDHLQPEHLLEPRSRLDDAPLQWRTEPNAWAEAPDPEAVARSHRAAGVPEHFVAVAERNVLQRGARARITSHGDWGISTPSLPAGRVYGNSYYLHALYCAGHAASVGHGPNALEATSDTTVIGVFGIDNANPGLVSPHVISQATAGRYKPFDVAVVHGMVLFEGRKCSTSKRHGMWVAELLGSGLIDSDELRWTLAGLPLTLGPADLTVKDLVDRVNELREGSQRVAECARDGAEPFAPLGDDHPGLVLARASADLLSGSAPDLPGAVDMARSWIAGPGISGPGGLTAWSLLTAPLTPRAASALWRAGGRDGEPTFAGARLPGHSIGAPPPVRDDLLTGADLAALVHLEGCDRPQFHDEELERSVADA